MAKRIKEAIISIDICGLPDPGIGVKYYIDMGIATKNPGIAGIPGKKGSKID